MNDEFKLIAAIMVIGIVIAAVIDLLKLSKEPKTEGNAASSINLASLPAGSIIVLPKGAE